MKERRSSLVATAVLLISLPVLYVGSYLSLVERSRFFSWNPGDQFYVANYRLGGSAAKNLYWPVHLADRNVRRDYWRANE